MKKLIILLILPIIIQTLGICKEKLAPHSIMFDYNDGLRIQGTSVRLKLPQLDRITPEDDFDSMLAKISASIIEKYPYLKPVYLIRLKGKVDKTIFNEDPEFLDIAVKQYGLGLVTEEQAKTLHMQGESICVAYEINTSNHGRQVFFPDKEGSWFGLKGVGVPPAYKKAHPHQGVTGNMNFRFHEDIDDATGATLVSERMEGLMRQEKSRSNIEYASGEILRKRSLFAGAGIANIVLDELWNGVEAQKLSWNQIAGNKVHVDADGSVFTPLSRVGVNVEVLYYGKNPPLRIRDLHEIDKTQMDALMLNTLGFSKNELNVNQEVVEAYLRQVADQLARDFSFFLNNAQVHGIPHDDNIIVDGHLTDFEVVTDIPMDVNDFFAEISHSSIVRDLTYINESLKVLIQIVNKLNRYEFSPSFAQRIFEQKLREYVTDQGALSLMQIVIGQVFIYLDHVLQARQNADPELITAPVSMQKMSSNDIGLLRQQYIIALQKLGRIIRASNFNSSIPALIELQRIIFVRLAFPKNPADQILKCEDDDGLRYRIPSHFAWQRDGDMTEFRIILKRLMKSYYLEYVADPSKRQEWIRAIRADQSLETKLHIAA